MDLVPPMTRRITLKADRSGFYPPGYYVVGVPLKDAEFRYVSLPFDAALELALELVRKRARKRAMLRTWGEGQ